MASRKYVKDYKLNHTVDAKGRLKSEPEYVGAYFVFTDKLGTVKQQAFKSLIACGGAWVSLLGSMLLNTGAMRLINVSLPYAFTAIPLWLLTAVCIKARKINGKMQHRDSDEMNQKYPACSMWAALLPLLSLLGMLAALIFKFGNLVKADIAFALLASVTAACSAYCFRNKNVFKTEEL